MSWGAVSLAAKFFQPVVHGFWSSCFVKTKSATSRLNWLSCIANFEFVFSGFCPLSRVHIVCFSHPDFRSAKKNASKLSNSFPIYNCFFWCILPLILQDVPGLLSIHPLLHVVQLIGWSSAHPPKTWIKFLLYSQQGWKSETLDTTLQQISAIHFLQLDRHPFSQQSSKRTQVGEPNPGQS